MADIQGPAGDPHPEQPRRPLPRADRLTPGYRLNLAARRVRGRLGCLVGRHDWVQRRTPDLGGPEAVWFQCRRCGAENTPLDPRQAWF